MKIKLHNQLCEKKNYKGYYLFGILKSEETFHVWTNAEMKVIRLRVEFDDRFNFDVLAFDPDTRTFTGEKP